MCDEDGFFGVGATGLAAETLTDYYGLSRVLSAGRRDSHQVEAKGTSPRGVYLLGAGNWRQKELAQEPEPNANNKKQWAQGPIWILLYGRWRAGRIFAMPRFGEGGLGGEVLGR